MARRSHFFAAVTWLSLVSGAMALDVKVWPEKLCAKPGQPVNLRVTVSDPSAEIACRVTHQIDTVAATFTGKPDAKGVVVFTFTPTAEWGYEVSVTATAKGETASASEVFSCASNAFKVAVDHGVPEVYGPDLLPDGSAAPEGPVQSADRKREIADAVARFRDQYQTVAELMGPAFCSFSSIVPPTLNYYKGAHYHYSVNAQRQLIRDLRDNGIATLMYVNSCGSGVAGTEFVRKHPEFLAYQPDGTPFIGGLDMAAMDIHRWFIDNYPQSQKQVSDWQKQNPQPEAVTFYKPASLFGDYPGFINAWLDFQDPEVSRIGAEKIIEAQKYFGFDGVRYDGEYRVPSFGDPIAAPVDLRNWQGERQPSGAKAEELTARNLKLAFGMMRKHDPNFMIALNNADFRTDVRGDAALSAPNLPAISPGVWLLDEIAKGALNPSAPEHLWGDFIQIMADQVDRVRTIDNYLVAGWGGGPGQNTVDTRQVKAVSWACGARWISGGYSKERWFAQVKRDYNRFALRYSAFILDNRLRRLRPAEAQKTVSVSGSRPVIWQPFVQRLQTEDRRYLVIHLINEPLEKGLTVDAKEPPKAEGLVLTLAPGEKFTAAHFLTPDGPTAKLTPDGQKIALPALSNWAVVVIEQ